MRSRPLADVGLPASVRAIWLVVSGWPRRILAASLLLIGVMLLFIDPKPAAQEGSSAKLVVMAKNLPAGASLIATDLRLAAWPAGLIPDGAVHALNDAIGKPLAGAVSVGEPLTAARLLNTSISDALAPGQVAVSVTLRDTGQTAILQAGAQIDLYVAATDRTTAGPVASDVTILAVLPDTRTVPPLASSATSATIVIACDRATAAELAQASGGQFLASLRPQQ